MCSEQRHALTIIYFHHSDATAYFIYIYRGFIPTVQSIYYINCVLHTGFLLFMWIIFSIACLSLSFIHTDCAFSAFKINNHNPVTPDGWQAKITSCFKPILMYQLLMRCFIPHLSHELLKKIERISTQFIYTTWIFLVFVFYFIHFGVYFHLLWRITRDNR